MSDITYTFFIQCRGNDGNIGDFIRDSAGVQHSPTFPSVMELCDWMRVNGWRSVPNSYFYVERVAA